MLRRLSFLATFTIMNLIAMGCTIQLVAPYNSDLQLKASSMQAEVAAWDLKMRNGAGTILNDPRHPDVAAMINKWHGEAEAMLTLAASNDPGMANCSEAVKAVYSTIENSVPVTLQTAAQSAAAVANTSVTPHTGCESGLVSQITTGINDVEKALKYCQVTWVPDAYFTDLGQNRATAPTPPSAPNTTAKEALHKHCLAEFKVMSSASTTGAVAAHHGRAVSALLTTLQSIVYVENRKKAATSK